MAAPLAKQVLYMAGGDVLSKYGTLAGRKAPPAAGGEIPYTFTRTGTGLYLANDVGVGGLKLATAPGDTARLEQLIDPVTGALQNYWKMEPAATNSCLQSQALATSPWNLGLSTVTNNAGVAPDGTTTASSIIPTAVNGPNHYASQAITVTANEFVACSVVVKAIGAYTGLRMWCGETLADSNAFWGAFDLTGNGQSQGGTAGTGIFKGTFIIPLGNGWYWCGVWGANTTTTDQWQAFVFPNYANAVSSTSYTGDGTSGLLAWGAQLERNGAVALPPTSYIATTTVPVARNAEAAIQPWYIPPAGLGTGTWFYIRFLERGGVILNNSGGPFLVGTALPFLRWDTFQNPGYRFSYQTAAGTPTSTPSGVPTFGQVVELLGLFYPDGSVEGRQAIQQGAETTGGRSAANAMVTQWSGLSLRILNGMPGLLSRFVVGTGVGAGGVATIADVRNTL